jgi:hypothetical protein
VWRASGCLLVVFFREPDVNRGAACMAAKKRSLKCRVPRGVSSRHVGSISSPVMEKPQGLLGSYAHGCKRHSLSRYAQHSPAMTHDRAPKRRGIAAIPLYCEYSTRWRFTASRSSGAANPAVSSASVSVPCLILIFYGARNAGKAAVAEPENCMMPVALPTRRH